MINSYPVSSKYGHEICDLEKSTIIRVEVLNGLEMIRAIRSTPVGR